MPGNENREKLIEKIKTGFNFFALIVLSSEMILGVVAVRLEKGPDRTLLLWAAICLLGLLTMIVTVLLVYKPWVLSGGSPPSVIIQALNPAPYLSPDVAIRYYLRGIRESYFHRLHDSAKKPPQHIRLNVMLVLPIADKTLPESALKIVHVDYPDLFSNDEFTDVYPIGSAKCGEAWQLKHLRFWAADRSDSNKVPNKKKTSARAQSCRSVVSSPFFCEGTCIGVLNLDSEEDSDTTHVQLPVVHDLLSEAAREIVPLLFPLDKRSNDPRPKKSS
jgi:hypothetical protein